MIPWTNAEYSVQNVEAIGAAFDAIDAMPGDLVTKKLGLTRWICPRRDCLLTK